MRHPNYKQFDKPTGERWDSVAKRRIVELILENQGFEPFLLKLDKPRHSDQNIDKNNCLDSSFFMQENGK